jgi:hypothetical protein
VPTFVRRFINTQRHHRRERQVAVLQQTAVVVVFAATALADRTTPEGNSRFVRAMMLFFYTLSVRARLSAFSVYFRFFVLCVCFVVV